MLNNNKDKTKLSPNDSYISLRLFPDFDRKGFVGKILLVGKIHGIVKFS
jgi:hypothetical protein